MTFHDLVGLTMTSVTGGKGDEQMTFVSEDGRTFSFYHDQDCCESVDIEDVIGDVADLVGSPILEAEEIVNSDENPSDVPKKDYQDSFTWTFYRFTTAKGVVTVRWYGSSNGYYSERVSFREERR